jgi:hypothetical protein
VQYNNSLVFALYVNVSLLKEVLSQHSRLNASSSTSLSFHSALSLLLLLQAVAIFIYSINVHSICCKLAALLSEEVNDALTEDLLSVIQLQQTVTTTILIECCTVSSDSGCTCSGVARTASRLLTRRLTQ